MSFFKKSPAGLSSASDPAPGDAPGTTTLIVRDVPTVVRDGIDLAMRTSPHRKREAFLRDHLERAFGPESATFGASRRFHDALEYIFTLGATSIFHDPPTLARLARALGHASVADLDAQFRGDVPLTFGVGDKTAELYGISRDWLHDNEGTPFRQSAKFLEPYEVLRSFYRDGIPYDNLHFVLEVAPRGTAALFGEISPLRYDLLLQDMPVHGDVGGGGQARIEDLGGLLALVAHIGVDHATFSHAVKDRFFPTIAHPQTEGYELESSFFESLVKGAIHPAVIFRAMRREPSVWHDYFADIERSGDFSDNFNEAHARFVSAMRSYDVLTNAGLVEFARKRRIVPLELSPAQAVEVLVMARTERGSRPSEEDWAPAEALVAAARDGDVSAAIQLHLQLERLGKGTPSWCAAPGR